MNIDNLDKFHTFVSSEVINYNQINSNNDIIINALKALLNIEMISETDYNKLQNKDSNKLYMIYTD